MYTYQEKKNTIAKMFILLRIKSGNQHVKLTTQLFSYNTNFLKFIVYDRSILIAT